MLQSHCVLSPVRRVLQTLWVQPLRCRRHVCLEDGLRHVRPLSLRLSPEACPRPHRLTEELEVVNTCIPKARCRACFKMAFGCIAENQSHFRSELKRRAVGQCAVSVRSVSGPLAAGGWGRASSHGPEALRRQAVCEVWTMPTHGESLCSSKVPIRLRGHGPRGPETSTPA